MDKKKLTEFKKMNQDQLAKLELFKNENSIPLLSDGDQKVLTLEDYVRYLKDPF